MSGARAALVIGLVLGGLALGGLGLHATRPAAPAFDAVRAAHGPSDARLLDRHGAVLATRRVDPVRRRLDWVALADVSPALTAAVLAAEDRRFLQHDGVDARAVVAAAVQALRGGGRRGASTVTMQLAALLDPALRPRAGGRTLAQKWRQMRAARALERAWSKDQILEAYLNLVDVRGELSGVGAAAAALFGATPDRLDAAESTVLAALLAAPSAPPRAVERRAAALRRGVPDPPPAAAVAAATRRALARRPALPPAPDLALHVARRLLTGPDAVRSMLDAGVQRAAAAVLRRTLLAIRDHGVRDGAVLVVDNASGEVLAYVGSGGAQASAPHVDGVRARRQAGSTLKPFLYGLALERRLLTPASLLEDAPLEIGLGAGVYRPENYDDRYRGLVSVRTALAASLNTPAVRTLGLVGGDAFVGRLRALGFDGLRESAGFYGPSLALGSADVSLWELVGAYRTLAAGGRRSALRLTPDAPSAARQVVEPATTFLIADMLADRAGRSATFGLENPLATRFWTAVKTGTSTDMRDNWCVGFSRRYTVGVWVGNFSGEPMHDVSGVTGAAPVWLEVMDWLHRRVPSDPPAPPAGVVATRVSFPRAVEPPRREWTLAGTEDPAPALTPGPPRIRTPVAGARFALDPDVPPDRQRLHFEAAGATAGLRWRCDGRDAGPVDGSRLWPPEPGRHALELVDAAGAVRDHVAFEVRGAVLPAPSCSRSCGITAETSRPGHARVPVGGDPHDARLPVFAAFRH